MKLTIATTLLCASALVATTQGFAAQDLISLRAGYDIEPHKSLVLKGNTFSDNNFKCLVRTHNKEESSNLNVIATKHDAVINNSIVREGETFLLPIEAGKKLYFTIDKRGRITLTNEGQYMVNLKCND